MICASIFSVDTKYSNDSEVLMCIATPEGLNKHHLGLYPWLRHIVVSCRLYHLTTTSELMHITAFQAD